MCRVRKFQPQNISDTKIYSIHVSTKMVCHEYQKINCFILILKSRHSSEAAENGWRYFDGMPFWYGKQSVNTQPREKGKRAKINNHLLSTTKLTLMTRKFSRNSNKLELDFTSPIMMDSISHRTFLSPPGNQINCAITNQLRVSIRICAELIKPQLF